MSDLISRQAAIAHAVPLNLFGREVMMVSVSELENLPSAQPVRHGKWMKSTERNKEWWWFCSNCQEQYFEDDLYMNEKHFPKYCPNCGAKMDGEQEKQNETD